ncbi:E3 ubiquitin-protein ligase [Pancytospora epiphaga]|nr:E3 ubiquitin-protein ligase [Pancytospora epiphaga]
MDCFICCGPLEVLAKYPCSHIICHKCAVKLIFMYGDKTCPFCKASQGKPIFNTEDSRGCEPNQNDRPYSEDSNACYASEVAYKRVRSLLLKKCKYCKRVFKTGNDLIRHFKDVHGSLLCHTCVNHNHQFWFELVVYNPESLEKHKHGLLNEAGFTGHILCTHCKIYFYNKEEAKKHCQAAHQLCTVCDVLGKKQQFYCDYKDLEQHYRAKHYCCTDSLCLKNLCYVFAYKSELWTHCLEQHSLDVKLTDICLSGRKNPPVCSVGDSEGGDAFSVYRQETNITNTLINEPYFPSFESASLAVPSYMNRQILSQAEQVRESRLQQIRLFTKRFCEEINLSIEKYIEGSKSFDMLVGELETVAGKRTTLQMLENLPFLHKTKEIKEHIKEYKKAVLFPPFQKSEKKVPEPNKPKINSFISNFKVLDLTKKK